MARDSNSFKRQKSKFKPQPKVLVICEDSKSGKRYLEDASLHFRVSVVVEITHCGKTDPLNIVKEAISRQGKFDHIFCAIDRDTHETFGEALKLVNTAKKVEIIASYPCFEFWLLLHFGYNRSSRPRELPPQALTEPYVRLSPHTALHVPCKLPSLRKSLVPPISG